MGRFAKVERPREVGEPRCGTRHSLNWEQQICPCDEKRNEGALAGIGDGAITYGICWIAESSCRMKE